MKRCLIINNREPIDESLLDDISDLISCSWYQKRDPEFLLEEAFASGGDVEILVTNYADLSAAMLKRLPVLRAIITTTTAVEYIDCAYCLENSITVCHCPGYTGRSVAEHVFALLLSAARQIPELDRRIRTRDFQCFECSGIELFGKTLGIIGMGNIGTAVAMIARGFGLEVVFCNRTPKEVEGALQIDEVELLEISDFIAVTVSENESSRGLLGREQFARMKDAAVLASISPDEVIEFEALRWALTTGQIRCAALDLLWSDERYLDLPNLILTPRRAWYTLECVARRQMVWKETLKQYLLGDPVNVVVA